MSGVRQKRIKLPQAELFLQLLEELPLVQDSQPITATIRPLLALADEYRLTAYDTLYLELALRHAVPLATLNSNLRKAAKKAGAPLFTARP